MNYRRIIACVIASVLFTNAQADTLAVGDTTFGSTVFADATHLDQRVNGKPGKLGRNSVDLRRLYLSLDHRFSDVWSVHLVTDINWTRNQSPTDLWVRNAYLQGAFNRYLTLRLGAADLPWASFANRWNGYRYVDNELVSRLGFASTADWGAHAQGDLSANGRLQYAVAMVTGSGFKRPRLGSRADVETRVSWQPTRNTVVAVGGYDGTRGMDGGAHVALHTARRFDAMAAYADERWRFGAQFFRATDWNNVRTAQGDRADGWSAWASVQFAPRWSAFARVDQARTSRLIDPSLRDRYANVGVAWAATPKLQLALAAKRERFADARRERLRTREIGVWMQWKP